MLVKITRERAERMRRLADDSFTLAVRAANKHYDRDHDWRAFDKAVRQAGRDRDHVYGVTEEALR